MVRIISLGRPHAGKSAALLLALMTGTYVTVASTLSILRYESLLTQATDLGIFMQALYSTLHGRVLYEAVDYQAYGATSFLGVHFSPILFAVVPLYAIFPYASTLLILQAFAVGAGSVPTYLISKAIHGKGRALVFSAFYLVYAPLLGANLYDFHVEAFLPVLLLFVFYLIQARKYLRALLPIALSLTTTEAAPPLIASLMLYFIIQDRRNWKSRRVELVLLATMVPIYFSMRYVMGIFSPGQGVAAGLNLVSFLLLPASLPSKLTYFLVILAAAGFLPLLAPSTAILSLPWVLVQLFSDGVFPHSVGWQYEFFVIPWVIVGSICGFKSPGKNWLARVLKRDVGLKKVFWLGVALSLIVSPAVPLAVQFLDPPFSGQGYVVSYSVSAQYPQVANLAKEIGSGPILVSNHLFPYLANNLDAYDFEPNFVTLGSLVRVPPLRYLLMQGEDISQLPSGILTQFSLVATIAGGSNHEYIYLYQKLPGN